MIDPQTLTSESLYKLQSETWSQGAQFERERIIKVIKDFGSEDFTTDLIALIKGEQK